MNPAASPVNSPSSAAQPAGTERSAVPGSSVALASHLTTAAPTSTSTPEFFNRELSWLEFNRRVLNEAIDPRIPLLERVRFLGIFTSNLDEFFMKRVGGLKRQIAAGVTTRTVDGLSPVEQLDLIRRTVATLLTEQAECYRNDIRPALAANGIHLLAWSDLTAAERDQVKSFFRQNVFPVLTPLAVDPGHPFPFISNLSLSLGVTLSPPGSDDKLFARVKIPEILPQWIRLQPSASATPTMSEAIRGVLPLPPREGAGGGLDSQPASAPTPFRFISLTEIVRRNLADLFPDMTVLSTLAFRVTRNADIERDEEDADDLLELIEQELRQRRFEKVVRFEHGPNPDRWMLQFLIDELDLSESDVYEVPAELDYTDLRPISDLTAPSLSHEPAVPVVPPPFNDESADLFSLIRANDLLVHHPFESFAATTERFIAAAADDPRVIAIKITLYRTGENSPFIHTLIRAAEEGKHIVAIVELKARFDEERNIYWAQALEKAGVHVVYGIVGLKTHCKSTLVVRQEADGVRCYAHIGTGNYHAQTARLYTDVGLFTAKQPFTDDLVELFHYLTGRSLQRDYRRLLVAPVNMKDRFLGMIHREIEHANAGRPARIVAKFNSLEDQTICRALYAASAAGVQIDLIVRGVCCLRPRVPGLSENIRVTSVIGRFLEHSRIFHFANAAADPVDGEFYIGSADWMYRNLHNRVEIIAPVEDRPLRERLWEILQVMLDDERQAWDLHPDGHYSQRISGAAASPTDLASLGTHAALMSLTRRRAGLPSST